MTEENYQQPPEEGGNKITISQGSFLDRLVNSDEFNKSMKKKEKEVEKIGQVMTKVTKNASLAFKQKGGLKTILDGFKHRSLKEIAVGAKTIVKRKATFSEMIEASYDRALNSKEAIKRNIDNAAEGLRDISSQINTLLEEKSTLAISHEEKSIELQGYNSQIASYENDLGNLSTTDKKFHLKQAELQKSLNEVVQSKTELSLEIFSINASIKAKNEGYDLLCSIRTEAETRLPGFETLYAIATSRLETADIIVRNAVKSAKVSEDITNYYADLKQLEEVLEGESELASEINNSLVTVISLVEEKPLISDGTLKKRLQSIEKLRDDIRKKNVDSNHLYKDINFTLSESYQMLGLEFGKTYAQNDLDKARKFALASIHPDRLPDADKAKLDAKRTEVEYAYNMLIGYNKLSTKR